MYVTAEYPYGRAETFLHEEVAALCKAGVQVIVKPVQFSGGALRSDFLNLGAEVGARRIWNIASLLRFAWWVISAPKDFLRVLGVLRQDKGHLLKNLAVLPSAVHSSRSIAHLGVRHIHAHWLSTSATFAMLVSILSGVPYSVTAHRWDIVDGNLVDAKYRSASFIRFISESGRMLSREIHDSMPSRGVVVHLGVTLKKLSSGSSRRRSTFRALCPAALKEVKGHRYLIDALASLDSTIDIDIDLAGDGPLKSWIRTEIEARGLSGRLHLVGHTPHRQLIDSLGAGDYDAVVLPSVDLGGGMHEGIPVSLMEAMAAGVAVISTRTGGIPELIVDGREGILVEGGDAGALRDALARVSTDHELRDRLGTAGRLRIARDFCAQECAAELLALIMSDVARPLGDG